MSFTNSTTNYHLPQYVSTDIPSYLVDQNTAWSTVDTNLKAVSDVANGADTKATNAGTAASDAQSTANTANTKAEGALSNEADTYNATETYSLGDRVIYNSILYRCKTDISVPEVFDSSKWERDTLESMINSAYSGISSINTALGNTDISSIGDGSVTGAIHQINSNVSDIDLTDLPVVDITNLSGGLLGLTKNCFWKADAGTNWLPSTTAGWCGVCVFVSNQWALYVASSYQGGNGIYVGWRTSGTEINWHQLH